MNRVIEFRAQRVDNKEWVYGQYMFNPLLNRGEVWSFDTERCYVYEVIPETVGQFTGLEDNNGWIRIESEKDLPKKGTSCHFILENGFQGIFKDIGDVEYLTLRNRGTYYQPIIKPKPPIY